jgi:hypothetical protein
LKHPIASRDKLTYRCKTDGWHVVLLCSIFVLQTIPRTPAVALSLYGSELMPTGPVCGHKQTNVLRPPLGGQVLPATIVISFGWRIRAHARSADGGSSSIYIYSAGCAARKPCLRLYQDRGIGGREFRLLSRRDLLAATTEHKEARPAHVYRGALMSAAGWKTCTLFPY